MTSLPRTLPRLLALLLLLASAPRAADADGGEWRLETADAGGVTLRWTLSPAPAGGNPEPRSVTLGIPPGAAPTARLDILSESPAPLLPALRGRAAGVTVSRPARYRDLEIAVVTLDPALPGRRLESARVRVDFRTPAARAGAPRPAFAPPATGAPERHLRGWILNYEQARGFRAAAPAPATALAKGAAGSAGSAAWGPTRTASLAKVRLVVRTRSENIAVIDHAALEQAGVPLGRIDPRFMRLFHDGVEVPMHVTGGDDGRWDRGDYIEFIGKAPKGENTFNSLYSSTAAFVLTWDGGRLGLRAPAAPVAVRGGDPSRPGQASAKEAPPFRVLEHKEIDKDILRIGNTSEADIVDLGANVARSELTDFWMWERQGVGKDALTVPFTLDNEPVPQGEGSAARVSPLRVRVNLKGITNNPKADPDHHVKFILNGIDISLVEGVQNDAVWEGQEAYTWTSHPLNPKILKQGRNELVIQKVNDLRGNDGSLVEVQDAFLNWFELDFPSRYTASGDVLRFANAFEDSLGVRLFTLQGFTRPELSVWDAAGRKLTGWRVTGSGRSYTVSLVDSLAGPTRYLACALDKREVPRLELDTLPELVSPPEGADYLVVTGPELLGSALDSLLEHRRKQGLRVRTVLARHVYQAFGDGSLDPAALRRFVEHAYRAWPRPAPAYLLLLGETSQWYEKAEGAFQKTIVPTRLVNIHGWGVAASDDWFAKVSGDDGIADLFVGRIPVSTREELSRVVRKTLALEARPAGHWSNKSLLVAGYEETFTLQNNRLQALAVSRDRQFSRLDLYPKSPHYPGASRLGDIFAQLDSAFSVVAFVGHGGGAVWSDGGVLTLKHLDEGRLKGTYPIPLVSSITCLTGYFEDVSARSLGEEMVRLEGGGAATFYGAAGYISNLAGEALSFEVLDAAASGAEATAGAIIQRAETMVHLRTGDAYLPILEEFNLLGDPALRIPVPARAGNLEATPRTRVQASSVSLKGSSLSPATAEGLVTLYQGDVAVSTAPARVSGGAWSADLVFPFRAGSVPDGKAVLHYWDGKEGRVASAGFTALDWLIDSVGVEPAAAAPGDSVTLRLRLATAQARTRVEGGIAFYAVDGVTPPLFDGENQTALRTAADGSLETVSRIRLPLPPAGVANPRLHVAFRLTVTVLGVDGEPTGALPNVASRIFSLPLSDLARLSLVEPVFRVPVQEEAGVWVVFRNGGLGDAADFSVILTTDAEGPGAAEATKAYPGKLVLGAVDSLFFPLADSLLLGRRLRAAIRPGKEGDLADRGTMKDTVPRIATAVLRGPADTLRLDTAAFLTLPAGAKARRVFAESRAVDALPRHLAPAAGSLPVTAWMIRSPGFTTGALSLAATSPATDGAPKAAAGSAVASADRPAWHFRALGQTDGRGWLRLDTAAGASFPWAAPAFRDGLYALLVNRDRTPPLIQLSSRGQALLADDYVPQGTPIDVVIRDAEGVDMALRPPEVKSRRQTADTANLAAESAGDFPSLVRYNFLPKHGAAEDSLEITARDVSGNLARRVLAYRLGDDLAIRGLGSYPNPFADTAVFVYTLTDYCEKVTLKVYSRAGRLVRSLEERGVVGYREVVWDGRSNSGGSIGNGLYFLKVTARAGDKETSKVFKLFKKRRK